MSLHPHVLSFPLTRLLNLHYLNGAQIANPTALTFSGRGTETRRDARSAVDPVYPSTGRRYTSLTVVERHRQGGCCPVRYSHHRYRSGLNSTGSIYLALHLLISVMHLATMDERSPLKQGSFHSQQLAEIRGPSEGSGLVPCSPHHPFPLRGGVCSLPLAPGHGLPVS